MTYGVGLHAGFPADRFMHIVRHVERLGFDHLWVADEALFRDPYSTLTMAALSSTRLRLGIGVTNPYTRHPALTAAAIATVDELSGGRMVLGLGAGGSAPLALGSPKHRPVDAVRDTVAIISGLLEGGRVDHHGAFHTFRGTLDFRPQRRVPIFIGTRGPRLLEVAGEVADGVILGSLGTTDAIRTAARYVEAGARRAGRDAASVSLVSWLATSLSTDRRRAVEAVSSYVAVAAITSRQLLPDIGDQIPSPVRDLLERQRWERTPTTVEAVRSALTDEMIDRFSLAGPPETVRSRIRELSALGLSQVSILIAPPADSSIEDQLSLFAQEVMEHKSAS